ncbi:MAG: hypothetical protein AAB839_01055 [Patescibacteria group bacterium]
MTIAAPSFPLVEAILITPPEGAQGQIGICSNTTAPGQVLNEVDESLREYVSVIGPLIVSRDGGERMIVNSLAHPSLRYLVLFSEESTTFAPCTNLLLALMDGFDESKTGNYIRGGVAASAHYPSITPRIFDEFRKTIIVLPAFMPKHAQSKEVIARYLEWLKQKVRSEIYDLLVALNQKDKIYYDALKKLLAEIAHEERQEKPAIALDAKEFQHLQPPKILLDPLPVTFPVPFIVQKEEKHFRLDVRVGGTAYSLVGDDPFMMGYSLMKRIGEDKQFLSPLEQILLGAELSRVSTELTNGLSFSTFVRPTPVGEAESIPLESKCELVMDSRYYYKVNAKNGAISTMCLAFDVCESVFELITPNLSAMADRLARENRFEKYPMDILHRIDIGIQLGCAAIAANLGYSFIQDFATIFKINTERFPSVVVEGDSFLDVHKSVLRKIYTEGITEEHGDPWKGLARTACVLAIYRDAANALEAMPVLYRQGDQDPAMVRAKYKEQLLRFDHDGTYTYGERTRAFFGFDQLARSIEILKNDSTRATIVQRFDPATDMSASIDPDTGKEKFTHDPCLTHDIFFVLNGKLHSFHIARAHNTVNAYPENVFGLFDAYATTIRTELGLSAGDMYMLSSRANILLLTEEQRAKKILGEPSKPIGDVDTSSGPYLLGESVTTPLVAGGVAYSIGPLSLVSDRPNHPSLTMLESYNGVDTITKAVDYLASKGVMHNNITLSEHRAGQSDPQADQLAFFQMNVLGKKVYVTMVWMNRSIANRSGDVQLANYIATRLQQKLGGDIQLGEFSLYYVAYTL